MTVTQVRQRPCTPLRKWERWEWACEACGLVSPIYAFSLFAVNDANEHARTEHPGT